MMAVKAYKLPSGNWNARVQLQSTDGKRRYKSFTAPTKKEAEYLAARFVASQQEANTPVKMTVGEAVDAFISARTSILSPTTMRSYIGIRKNHMHELENVKLSALTNRAIQMAMNHIAEDHSPKTVSNVYTLLTAALSYSFPEFRVHADLPRKQRTEIIVPTKEDIAKLLSFAKDTPVENAILLAAGYGLRRGEICAMTYADIDERRMTISVTKSLARGLREFVLKTPKSYAGTRTIPVGESLIRRLMENRHDAERICPLHPDALTNHFERIRIKAGVSCRFHDLRHYNASVMLAAGVPDKYAMERLGQSTPGVLRDVYQHLLADKRKEVANTMNEAFDSLCK